MLLRKKAQTNEKQMVSVQLDSFVYAVNEVIPAYINNVSSDICYSFYKKPLKTKIDAQCSHENITLCNMKVELWEAAFQSVIRDTNPDKYPHYTAIQSVLNYVLCEHKCTEFRLASEALSRLLYFHSPVKKEMKEYYLHIIQDQYTMVIDDGPEGSQPFLNLLIETLHNLSSDTLDNITYSTYTPSSAIVRTDTETSTAVITKSRSKKRSKTVPCAKAIDPNEKFKRVIFCLNFICDILEQNLIGWLNECESTRKKTENLSILQCILWSDSRNEGLITPFIQRIIALQKLTVKKENVFNHPIERLITLTSEVLRAHNSRVYEKYPFIGKLSLDLARELSLVVIEEINNGNDRGTVDYLTRLKPSWLRMLVASRVLGDMTGFQCDPELRSVITVMEHLEQIYKLGRQENRMKENRNASPADPHIVARFRKVKSVNSLFRTGLSRLHTACKDNDAAAVKALLTFPCLDLNLKDDTGYTSLHKAALKGSEDCVRELLRYAPKIGQVQSRVDTRARGPSGITPLMQAVHGGHPQICSLLLKHTGSVLLEDITDEDQTALDLCRDNNIREILLNYKKNKVETIYSKKEIHLATGNLLLVAKLSCNLLHSYFAVHRTWDVYHALKRYSKLGANETPNFNNLYEYSRYYRDFRTHVPKLRQMVMKLKKINELASINDVLYSIVSLNKS